MILFAALLRMATQANQPFRECDNNSLNCSTEVVMKFFVVTDTALVPCSDVVAICVVDKLQPSNKCSVISTL